MFVMSTAFAPLASMTQMSVVPPLELTNTIFEPSGENVGAVSLSVGRVVSRVWLAPLASIT